MIEYTYTYESIIINPSKEGIESLIGKEVYFEVQPFLCLKAANEKLASNSGILVEVYKDSINPFCVKGKSGSYKYPCIIEKKEEPKPKYVPFETLDEFIESYKKAEERIAYSNTRDYIASCGMWLRFNNDDVMCAVTEIWTDGVFIGHDHLKIKWKELFNFYDFIDGTPCGKEEDK